MPKISIITPLYNGLKTFNETAESVLKQDYTDWEWILFDDGSSDGTQDKARKLSEHYKDKIFYYEHEDNRNFGTAYTRNRAVEKSRGEIIAFIDQDDIWYENKLSHQLKVLESQKDCSMIYAPALYWYKEREFIQPIKNKGKDLNSGLYQPPELIEIFLGDLRGTPLPSAALVRKKNFSEVNGFEESIKGSEDIVLWLKLAKNYPVYFDKEVLTKYRRHRDSTLRQAAQSGKMDEWNLTFYKWVIEFLRENSASDRMIKENQYAYYVCLKKTAKGNYFESRKKLFEGLRSYPLLKKIFLKDFLLDLFLPFDISTKISAKIRFDIFGQK